MHVTNHLPQGLSIPKREIIHIIDYYTEHYGAYVMSLLLLTLMYRLNMILFALKETLHCPFICASVCSFYVCLSAITLLLINQFHSIFTQLKNTVGSVSRANWRCISQCSRFHSEIDDLWKLWWAFVIYSDSYCCLKKSYGITATHVH